MKGSVEDQRIWVKRVISNLQPEHKSLEIHYSLHGI